MQIGTTFSLTELIKIHGDDSVRSYLAKSFSNKLNKDIENFLLNNAVRFEQAKIARTFLILNENADILAYFSLSFKSIIVNTSKSQLKKLTGGLTDSNQINVFLIGQIGKNSHIENNPIDLAFILNEVYLQIEKVQKIVGGRAIILECEDNEKLIRLYEKHGFKLINTLNDKYHLKTMFITPKFEH